MYQPDAILRTLSGRGDVSAEGVERVRVRYTLVVERRAGVLCARGTLTGRAASLLPVWLAPDSTLRLADGRRLAISVTDLVGDAAEFESTGPVSMP